MFKFYSKQQSIGCKNSKKQEMQGEKILHVLSSSRDEISKRKYFVITRTAFCAAAHCTDYLHIKYEYECFKTHFTAWNYKFALLLLFVPLLSKSIRIHLNTCTSFTHDHVERHRNAFQPNFNAFGLSVLETSFFSFFFSLNLSSLNIQ